MQVYPGGHENSLQLLVATVQELSLARSLEAVVDIVRHAARQLTGADGATFVLRDGGLCHYVDEDAIEPLWKGRKFPLETCISGWSMLNRESVVIEDIYADPRIPADAYRPTFVKSLVMVPIRSKAPVGAIGNYWATPHRATDEEVKLLAALADSTSIALENVQLYATLERRVEERTAELLASRAELAAKNEALLRVQRHKDEMAKLLVHDLKSPANGIILSCKARLLSPTVSEAERRYWRIVQVGAEAIDRMAMNLLDISRDESSGFTPRLDATDVETLLSSVVQSMTPLAEGDGQRVVVAIETSSTRLRADAEALRRVLQNLVDNALRYGPSGGTVRLTAADGPDDTVELRVIDEGPGIPAEQRERIFDAYTRLDQGSSGASGHGLGLAFCRIAVHGHGGRIWIEDNAPRGTQFVVRLPRDPSRVASRSFAVTAQALPA